MKSVGTNLREARETQGVTLDEIGARTRITTKCLTAIEHDDVSKLSSPFFYKSFVRQYAEQVGLDFQQLSFGVEQLAATMREPDLPGRGEHQPVRMASIRPRIKRDFGWLYSAALFIGCVAAISSGYAAWHYQPPWLTDSAVGSFLRSLKPTQTASHTATPPTPKPVVKQPVSRGQSKTNAASSPGDSSGREVAPDSTTTVATVVPDSDPSVPVRKESNGDAGGSGVSASIVPEAAPQPNGAGIHLELEATERTWLSVTADGKTAYTGILEKEQVKVLDGQETAQIRTGNAAGVTITFNGKPIGAIGPRGTTRTVVFTKTSFEVFPPANRPQFTRATRIGG